MVKVLWTMLLIKLSITFQEGANSKPQLSTLINDQISESMKEMQNRKSRKKQVNVENYEPKEKMGPGKNDPTPTVIFHGIK